MVALPNCSFDFEDVACPAVFYGATFYVTIKTFYPAHEILGQSPNIQRFGTRRAI